jgi:membrane-bound serine protease (ClpP class)
MEAFVFIALIAVALMLAELALPTGGVLAAIGAIGLVIAGVLAIDSDSTSGDAIGAALIALGILSAITLTFVARKVLDSQRNNPAKAGTEEMIGAAAEARTSIEPEGRVFMRGTIWGARLAEGAAPARPGDKVIVEAVDGLTLVVSPQTTAAERSTEGAN